MPRAAAALTNMRLEQTAAVLAVCIAVLIGVLAWKQLAHNQLYSAGTEFGKIALPASLTLDHTSFNNPASKTGPQIWVYDYASTDGQAQLIPKLNSAFQQAGYQLTHSTDPLIAENGRLNLRVQFEPNSHVDITAEEIK